MHSFSSDCIAFGRKPISVISSITASVSGGESGWLIACIIRASCSGSMPVPAGSWPPAGISDRIRAIISSEPGPPGREAAHSRQPGMPGMAMPPGICGIAMRGRALRHARGMPGTAGTAGHLRQAAAEQAIIAGAAAAPCAGRAPASALAMRHALAAHAVKGRQDMSLSIDWARP
jgi:hypothetical protein